MSQDEILDKESFDFLVEADKSEPGFLKRMVDNFEKNSGELLEKLDRAMESKDYDQIKFCTHKLRGSAGALGANKLMKVASKGETLAGEKADFPKIEEVAEDLFKAFKESLKVLKSKI